MTTPESFKLVLFSLEGTLVDTESVPMDDLEKEVVTHFGEKFLRLSGDLDLPMEGKLPGDLDSVEFQINSDRNGAYVLYYVDDNVVFASLLMSGTDEEAETELMQVFKFLLLDTVDNDDPTEEEINAILNMSEFDFFGTPDRPVCFQIQFPSEPDPLDRVQSIMKMDRSLAAAFFACPRLD